MVDINNVVFPRKLLKKLILLYKDYPCLWDQTSLMYKNKQKRHDAISKLTELVQEYDPSATRVHVLRKIESLRACLRREHKRVLESRRKATRPEEVYTPHLWYYDLLSFVFNNNDDYYKINIKDATPPEAAAESEEEILGDEEPPFESQTFTLDYNTILEVTEIPSTSNQYTNYEDDQKSGKRQGTGIEDEYDAIGVNVAAKLRSLPPNMRILAEKLINDVLFQAQTNGLNASTMLLTTDPFKQE